MSCVWVCDQTQHIHRQPVYNSTRRMCATCGANQWVASDASPASFRQKARLFFSNYSLISELILHKLKSISHVFKSLRVCVSWMCECVSVCLFVWESGDDREATETRANRLLSTRFQPLLLSFSDSASDFSVPAVSAVSASSHLQLLLFSFFSLWTTN